MVGVFRELHARRFPIRRLVPVDAYGASDFRSIEADNTSAFNCRYVEGTSRWSEHAYGRAIDVNPIENPYVSGGRTSHRASVPYVDRIAAGPEWRTRAGPSYAHSKRSGGAGEVAGRPCRTTSTSPRAAARDAPRRAPLRGQSRTGIGRRWLAQADERPHRGAEHSAGERADDVDPDVAPLLVVEDGIERASGVERSARRWPHYRRRDEDEEPDQERSHDAVPGGSFVGRHGEDDHDEQRGRDDLEHERRPVVDPDSRRRMKSVSHLRGVDDRHYEHRAESADELRDPVGDDVAAREPPGDRYPERDGGVEVATREVSECRDRERKPESESGSDTYRRDRGGADVDDDRDTAEAEEKKEERSDRFGAEGTLSG